MAGRILLLICFGLMPLVLVAKPEKVAWGGVAKRSAPTANHSNFKVLDGPFASPEEVTRVCLSCHTEAAKQVMKTSHYKWSRPLTRQVNGKTETVEIGKRNVLNNFCVSVTGNEARCTSCHAGYGWTDMKKLPESENSVDCLVCHEQTRTYVKHPALAGYPAGEDTTFAGKPVPAPDYPSVAKSVALPTRENCGSCHFYGGGGDAVKHGDIDSSLAHPSQGLDAHMGGDGANLNCIDCHQSRDHDIGGRLFTVSSGDEMKVDCSRCHGEKPHGDRMTDFHTEKLACQTCHIPYVAKGKPTKTWWDWSTAGKMDESGKPVVKKDADGNVVYHAKKGSFEWKKNLKPEYKWFNGKAGHVLIGDRVNPPEKGALSLNPLGGEPGDENSKIWPVKVMRGVQPWDPENKVLIPPKLFGKKESGAFWASYDWQQAAKAGMKEAGLEFSGKVGWIETETNWPLSHMVGLKSEVLSCRECHSADSRLAGVGGIYLAGRDVSKKVDLVGVLLILLSLGGVFVHLTLRIAFRRTKEGQA